MGKKKEMNEMLEKFNNKKRETTATHALNEEITTVEAEPETEVEEQESEKSLVDLLDKKKLAEDTHARATFWVRKDLLERLDNISKKRRGFKKEFINFILEQALDELEEAQRQKRRR